MDCEETNVDLEEYTKQYRENAEKNGVVFKVYLDKVNEGDVFKEHKKGDTMSSPNIFFKGNANAFTLAVLIASCENFFEEFKKRPDVSLALSILKFATTPKQFKVGGKEDNE